MSSGSLPSGQLSVTDTIQTSQPLKAAPGETGELYSLVGPEDLVRDLAEEDLLVRPQVRRRFLPDERFSVEERHLSAPLPPAAL